MELLLKSILVYLSPMFEAWKVPKRSVEVLCDVMQHLAAYWTAVDTRTSRSRMRTHTGQHSRLACMHTLIFARLVVRSVQKSYRNWRRHSALVLQSLVGSYQKVKFGEGSSPLTSLYATLITGIGILYDQDSWWCHLFSMTNCGIDTPFRASAASCVSASLFDFQSWGSLLQIWRGFHRWGTWALLWTPVSCLQRNCHSDQLCQPESSGSFYFRASWLQRGWWSVCQSDSWSKRWGSRLASFRVQCNLLTYNYGSGNSGEMAANVSLD